MLGGPSKKAQSAGRELALAPSQSCYLPGLAPAPTKGSQTPSTQKQATLLLPAPARGFVLQSPLGCMTTILYKWGN
jgi:hypothetical protein